MLLGSEIASIPFIHACDCCCSFIQIGTLAVVYCYEDDRGCLRFEWLCLECEGVSA